MVYRTAYYNKSLWGYPEDGMDLFELVIPILKKYNCLRFDLVSGTDITFFYVKVPSCIQSLVFGEKIKDTDHIEVETIGNEVSEVYLYDKDRTDQHYTQIFVQDSMQDQFLTEFIDSIYDMSRHPDLIIKFSVV